MLIKSVIIDNIHFINFITFNISTFFFSWFDLLKLECVLYAVKYGKFIKQSDFFFFFLRIEIYILGRNYLIISKVILCLTAYQSLWVLNSKSILRKERLWYYLTHSWEYKGVHAFSQRYLSEKERKSATQIRLLQFCSLVL